MPHVIIKIWPGKSEEQKQELADAVAQNVITILGSKDEAVSVSLEEVEASSWRDEVYVPDITAKPEQLYRKPGYSME
ncbi:MAG: tautomerase family protein [Rhodobacteraceae bacterium]|nr:tautomerase family protein [Paracoccaceae bacterium]